jgi:hypothetical protein
MDYLHGDVVENEFEAACNYEYARESAVLHEAARLSASKKHFYEEIALKIENKFRCGLWFVGDPWSLIWQCPSFPRKNWNEVSQRERANILSGFLPSQIHPLRMNEVWLLNAMGIFDEFKTMAEKVMENKRLRKPQGKVYPIIEGWPKQKQENSQWVHALFTIDFSKTKKRLRREFQKWLERPQNKERFAKHGHSPIGKTGVFKDRLKDLAAWRLYRELGCNEALAFAEKNRKRDKDGKPRQFHDARKEQSKSKMPLNEAPLYSEESGFLKAKARALQYRAELIPWEFGKYAKEREQQNLEWVAAFVANLRGILPADGTIEFRGQHISFKEVLEKAPKISKSSS